MKPVVVEPAVTAPLLLVIDDDPGARAVVGRVLERSGYRTLLATDGNEGLQLFRRHRDEIQLVLLDWHLPGPSGQKTLASLLDVRPDLRVVLISGDPEATTDPQATSKTVSILQKPFTPQALTLVVRTVLGA
jgi:CheY-like chemotaxis protein